MEGRGEGVGMGWGGGEKDKVQGVNWHLSVEAAGSSVSAGSPSPFADENVRVGGKARCE